MTTETTTETTTTPEAIVEVDVDMEKTPPCEFDGWEVDLPFKTIRIPHWGCKRPVQWIIRCSCSTTLGCNRHVHASGLHYCNVCGDQLNLSQWVKV